MKKKVIAALLSLALASQALPGTSILAAGSDGSLSDNFQEETVQTDNSFDDSLPSVAIEDAIMGAGSVYEESESEISDNEADDSSFDVETEDGEIFSDDTYYYRRISDTEVTVAGYLSEDITEIVIPSEVSDGESVYTVSAVEKDALSGLAAEILSLPSGLTEFGAQSLRTLSSVTVSSDNEKMFTKNGVLFSKDAVSGKNTLVLYPAASDAENYVIPENTGVIASYAFACTQNLKVLVFTEGLEKICEKAVLSPENPMEIAWNIDADLCEIEKAAVYFEETKGNTFYFENAEDYEKILGIQPAFVDSPYMYDSEGSLLNDYSDVIAFVTDGIPEKIQKIIEDAENQDKDESLSEMDSSASSEKPIDESTGTADSKVDLKDESVTEEAVGAGAESLDAKIEAGFYSIRNQTVNKFIKIKSAGINDSMIAYLAAHNIDMGTTFSIVPVGSGQYKIIACCSNKALTLNAGAGDNVGVVQKNYSGDKSQKWYIRESSSGVYKIYSVENDAYVLDTKAQKKDSATPIVIVKASSNETQGWKLVKRTDPTENALENGIYTISSALAANKVVDINGGSTANGANVQLYASNGTAAQQFILRSLGYGNLYRIINVASNKALDTQGKQSFSLANVQQANQDSSALTQIWRIVKSDDGKYIVLNMGATKALDLANASTANGTNIRIYDSNLTNAQKWNFKKIEEKTAVDVSGKDAEITAGWYTLSSARTVRTIAVKNAGMADNVNVLIQSPGTTGENSYFYVEPTGDGKYEIRAFCSNKNLTCVWGGDSVDAGNVVQKSDSNLSTQRWYIRVSKKNKNYLSIVSSSDQNYVLTLKNNDAKWGTSVTAALSQGLSGQRWKLNPITDPNLKIPVNGAQYKIQPAKNSGLVLSTEGQSKQLGANIQLMKKVNGAGEFWVFTKVGYGNLYRITNAFTGLAVDAKNGGTANFTNIWQYTENGSDAQLWRVMPTDTERTKFVIINALSGKVIDIYAADASIGSNIQLYEKNGTDAQEWTLSKTNNNTYIPVNTTVTIRTKGNTNRLIEVKDGSADNGAAVQVYAERGNTDQMFVFERKDAGIYKIRNVASNKYLDIKSTAEKAEVISTAAKNSDTQLWVIEASGDKDASFTIKNKKTGYALTSAYANNTKVITRSYTKAFTQRFYFDTPNIKTGWQQVGSNWRYYDSKGNALKDQFMENGKYYFDKNGNLLTGWKKYGSYYYYFKGKDGREVQDQRPYISTLYSATGAKRNSQSRPSCPYYFTIDTARCVVTWYTRYPETSDGWNLPVCAFLCSPGKDATPTDSGERRTGFVEEMKTLMGPSYGQFATEVKAYTYIAGTYTLDWTNNGEYFHSVACTYPNRTNLDPNTYNLLGTKQSHGCIRLGVRNAYWIYNFVDSGTSGYCGANMAKPINTIPQAWAINNIDPTDPHYTGNWGYVDNYATANTNGAFIPRG